jgi:hypothetical protein
MYKEDPSNWEVWSRRMLYVEWAHFTAAHSNYNYYNSLKIISMKE